jgi:hypothetical protein
MVFYVERLYNNRNEEIEGMHLVTPESVVMEELMKENNGKDNKTSAIRNSNFELLRIVCMFMIIAYHYSIHGNDSTIFKSDFSLNQAVAIIFGSWGLLGVNCFLFISAYFLLDAKRFSSKKLIKLLFQTISYSISMAVLLYAGGVVKFNFTDMYQSILSPFFNQYWFVTAYCMLYILYPFLNKIIAGLESRYLSKLLILLTLFLPVYKTLWNDASISNLSFVIYLYLLLGYLKKNPGNWFEIHAKKGFILTTLGIIAFTAAMSLTATKFDSHFFHTYAPVLNKRYSPAMVLDAIFLFYIFKNTDIKNSKLINNIAKTTLGIYLFHENPVLGNILWDEILKVKVVYVSPLFIVYMFASVILLFGIGALIDLIRIKLIEEPLFRLKINCIETGYVKVDSWVNND